MSDPHFIPTRAAGLDRLTRFLPRAGRDYAQWRNHDAPGQPHVSGLSPYLRHRLILESEVIAAATAAHGRDADKFVTEVWWRVYWKGWLEQRPGIWLRYRHGVQAGLNRVATEGGLRADWEAACAGTTGIDGFDQWAQDLVATGYLHNHARMWFASIWIFTLRLPWELGADFFMRHLIDGDAASNTLSWRWVAGLQTAGKTYLAQPDIIARCTGGRFHPKGLATHATALTEPPLGDRRPLGCVQKWRPNVASALLLHDDDLCPEGLLETGLRPVATIRLNAANARSPLVVAPPVQDFAAGALTDASTRLTDTAGTASCVFDSTDLQDLADWAKAQGAGQIVSPYASVGPVAETLSQLRPLLQAHTIDLCEVMRLEDREAWPHATHGFFPFRKVVMGE